MYPSTTNLPPDPPHYPWVVRHVGKSGDLLRRWRLFLGGVWSNG